MTLGFNHVQFLEGTQHDSQHTHQRKRELSLRTEDEMVDSESVSVIPAQVGFLSIYNPSLGPTDETLQDQIVYYYSSQSTRSPQRENASSTTPPPKEQRDDTNEKLRKIGLAQGMVNFSK
jgi:First Longin domain of INTU, CCZ1 and HPS4